MVKVVTNKFPFTTNYIIFIYIALNPSLSSEPEPQVKKKEVPPAPKQTLSPNPSKNYILKPCHHSSSYIFCHLHSKYPKTSTFLKNNEAFVAVKNDF